MANCPRMEHCIFFNDEMGDKPDIVSQSFKLRFCRGSNENCARWRVFSAMGEELVPRDLYPNQEERAVEILVKNKEMDQHGTE